MIIVRSEADGVWNGVSRLLPLCFTDRLVYHILCNLPGDYRRKEKLFFNSFRHFLQLFYRGPGGGLFKTQQVIYFSILQFPKVLV